MFIVHLVSFKWDEKSPFPSFKKLGAQMGISPSAARTYARSLQQKGYLVRESRDGKTTQFHLGSLFEYLEKRLGAANYIRPSLESPVNGFQPDENDLPP